MLTDLQGRYPEIDKRIAEWEDAFKGFPEELTLEQEDIAANLQDLLGQVKKDTRTWDAHAKGEKGPLNKLVKIVGNFFTTRVEKADALVTIWAPRYQAFLDKKKVDATRKMEEEAERQRQAAETARLAREKAEEEQRQAEARAAEERRKEQEAREAAAAAQRQRYEAEVRAAEAAAEERRLIDEKRVRDQAEKEENITLMRSVRDGMKEVEKLHFLAEADEANEQEADLLDKFIRPGGTIGALAVKITGSYLLDDAQEAAMDGLRFRLKELRDLANARLGKKEQAKRAKAAALAEAREAQLVAERRVAREAEEARMAQAKTNREREEAAAAAAKEEKRLAEKAARDARTDARSAESGAKAAGKSATRHDEDAQRAENRADRVETKLENSTDADLSRTRGELGTVGSLSRRWQPFITDEAALRANFYSLIDGAPQPLSAGLAEHLTTTALEGAIFHWMRAHQAGWAGLVRVENKIPGVVFAYEQEARIA